MSIKFKLIFILCFGLHYLAQAQVTTETYESFKLLEKREIKTYVPENYSPDKKYPLFVVLDAAYLFDNVVAQSKFFNQWQEMPEAIVVGIDQHKEREEDCTISPENGFPEKKGNQFFEFLGMELIPKIQKDYNIAPFKVIVGYDITANFTNYYLFKDNPLFNAYINISPDLATQMDSRLPERLKSIERKTFYYLASSGEDKKKLKRKITTLDQGMKGLQNEAINYFYEEFKGANHTSVAAYAIPSALDKIFNVFKPISPKEFKEKILKYEGPVFEYLEEKYNTIENLFGFDRSISLNDIMAIYAACLKKEDLPSLKQLSDIGKKEYPETMLGFFMLGEYYEKNGEPKKAMRAYEKAFGLEEIDFITKDLALDRIDAIKADFGW